MKISIVYFTSTGRTATMAEEVKKGIAATDAGIEVGLFPITELTPYNEDNIAFVNDSAAVIVGTPDYYAAEANQLKTWLDTCPCKLADKLCGAYATANFLQGGGDVAIQSVLTQLLVKGALIYSSGTAQGLPFIHLGPICLKGQEDAAAELFQTYGTRFAAKTKELFA
jgi:NAD(P)H dehydrogenase (quinone)